MNHNHPPVIIGLTGYAGVGKDTARFMLEEFGHIGFAFADPMRAMLRALFEVTSTPSDYMGQRELKELPIPGLEVSYRQLAQTLGTEWGRKCFGDDFWLSIASGFIGTIAMRNGCHPGLRFVVSDVRFANEAAWVKEAGGEVWRIAREGTAPVRDHTSESGMTEIVPDRTINNNGTFHDLRLQIAKILASYGKGAATP